MTAPGRGARLQRLAPAKLNLFLHVGELDPDGYHPLASLVVFADVGDRLSLGGAEALELAVEGPFGANLGGGDDNLVLKAVRALQAELGAPLPPLRLILDKRLPIAAGLGGGSSDAAAALRLLDEALELDLPEERLMAVAERLGADGPMCLAGRPVLAQGRGERLSDAPDLPPLEAVLVNPGAASPTGRVYAAYDASGAPGSADLPRLPDRIESAEELAAILSATRNDLQPPALALAPEIGEVLERLGEAPETLFARMSGSGATCFALCPGDLEAQSLADAIARERPGWWVAPCRLGGPWA